jgi:hypothetical protein
MGRIKLYEQFVLNEDAILEYQSNPKYAHFVDDFKTLVKRYQGEKLSKDAMMAAAQEIFTGVDSEGEAAPVEIDGWEFSLGKTGTSNMIEMRKGDEVVIVAMEEKGTSRATVAKDMESTMSPEAAALIKKIGLVPGEHDSIKGLWNTITNF